MAQFVLVAIAASASAKHFPCRLRLFFFLAVAVLRLHSLLGSSDTSIGISMLNPALARRAR
jgi:hypothetical protein